MLLKLAWKNIWRNRRRTLITISAIGFAVLFAVMMRSVNQGVEEQMVKTSVENRLGYIQIHTQGYWEEKAIDNAMFADDIPMQKIENLHNVASIAPALEVGMIVSFKNNSRGTFMSGIDLNAEPPQLVKNALIAGNFPDINKNEVLLGIELADFIDAEIGDTLVYLGVGYHGASAAGLYVVSGLLDFHMPELNRLSSYVGLSNLQELMQAPGILTSININLNQPKKLLETQTAIQKEMTNEYEVMTWKELLPDLEQLIQTSIAKGYIMNIILYLIISFVMFGTVLMATQERKYEMGVLQAIGMKRRKAMALVVIENVIISIFGVIVGALGAFPIMYYFHTNPLEITGEQAAQIQEMGIDPVIPFSIDPMILVNHGLVVLFISILLILYPIMIIRKLKPVEAMKL
ncbi:MAG: FtsX-like permease family protein [Putridiphycobacter sp.]|nr:FtsX-like permease family protein [Putridiphycobacter sp.]